MRNIESSQQSNETVYEVLLPDFTEEEAQAHTG